MINRVIQGNKKRTDYKTCPRCGANLDPGEICDCRKGAAMIIPFDKERVEKTLKAFEAVWAKAPKLNRDYIERQLMGGTIIGVYPLTSITQDGSSYLTGLSLAIKRLESREVITLDIDSSVTSYEDESSVTITKGYVDPEEMAFI